MSRDRALIVGTQILHLVLKSFFQSINKSVDTFLLHRLTPPDWMPETEENYFEETAGKLSLLALEARGIFSGRLPERGHHAFLHPTALPSAPARFSRCRSGAVNQLQRDIGSMKKNRIALQEQETLAISQMYVLTNVVLAGTPVPDHDQLGGEEGWRMLLLL